ncbi:hypothetical protein PBI_MIMI_275 [Arthrobacter phage Mimi]|nr:hypothetical protein PBI_MIMI_69 [Arthrobacter phage Mimi]
MLAIEKEIENGLKNGYSVIRFKKHMEKEFGGKPDWPEIDALLKEAARIRAHIYACKGRWAELEDVIFEIEMGEDVSAEDRKKVKDLEMKIIWSCYEIFKVSNTFRDLRGELDVEDDDVPQRKSKGNTVEYNYEDHLE